MRKTRKYFLKHSNHPQLIIFLHPMNEEDISVNDQEMPFPGYTEYEKTPCCFFFTKTKIPSINATFFGHWEVSLSIPCITLFLMVSSYIVFFTIILHHLENYKSLAFLLVTPLFLLFIISYIRIIVDGPGYFPFYWSNSDFQSHHHSISSPIVINESFSSNPYKNSEIRPTFDLDQNIGLDLTFNQEFNENQNISKEINKDTNKNRHTERNKEFDHGGSENENNQNLNNELNKNHNRNCYENHKMNKNSNLQKFKKEIKKDIKCTKNYSKSKKNNMDPDFNHLLIHDEESPAGIVSNKEQLHYVKKRPKPNRCIYSSTARRIVIRPDHFCDYTQSWIGKKNFKFFVLFNTYGFLYIFFFCIFDFVSMMIEITSEKHRMLAILFIYFCLSLMFMMMTSLFVCSHCNNACTNTTSWENWNGVNPSRYDQGCIENLEDVCGTRKKFFLWLFPISPWKGKTNFELIENYIDYGEQVA
ncbi:hypothetical protein TRFO_03756 [Tritrichomonas foetus]|uniref:Palmitoyltransferase n=1 Tax=Tritrichomonas foetus TaxID=1144522 RepID=A0A1J4KLE2_9EUKA|nr:hypothetical protein TRFO_03756 [Tritrichomonas foetus]|eukprot:OHT12119.1 hypothetical protein TRFO_03756 [Tritrichomonas foetus]